jgi:diacylglycerol O-acyltransferase-1
LADKSKIKTGNSESLGAYWRTWNKPVYQFFRRHVYSPMRSRGWSHFAASTTVFLLSAVLHELLVGIPTHNIIGNSPFSLFSPPPPPPKPSTPPKQT